MQHRRDFYQRPRPRHVPGGIKAQSTRGGFGQSWWAKRWISVLESFQMGARLARGRSYARDGQVLRIDVGNGRVTAEVQGSRPRPYQVSIRVKVLSDADWRHLLHQLSGQVLFVAKLLAGEMPQDIEEVFQKAGLSLFPRDLTDLGTDCNCPDWSNPCKHIAAVYYLMGEEFDRDPFLLFRLRGRSRDEFLEQLRRATPSAARLSSGRSEAPPPPPKPQPLPTDPQEFWAAPGVSAEEIFGDVQSPPVSAAWLKRLGNFPFWRGEQKLRDVLAPVYELGARRGIETFLGGRPV